MTTIDEGGNPKAREGQKKDAWGKIVVLWVVTG
jgi:hypothetical protein